MAFGGRALNFSAAIALIVANISKQINMLRAIKCVDILINDLIFNVVNILIRRKNYDE